MLGLVFLLGIPLVLAAPIAAPPLCLLRVWLVGRSCKERIKDRQRLITAYPDFTPSAPSMAV